MGTRKNSEGLSCWITAYLLCSRREDSRSFLLFTFKRFMANIIWKHHRERNVCPPYLFCLSYNKQLGDNSLVSGQVSCAAFGVVCMLEMSYGCQCQLPQCSRHHPSVPCATHIDLVFAEQELKSERWACRVAPADCWWESLSLPIIYPWGSCFNQTVPLIHFGRPWGCMGGEDEKSCSGKPFTVVLKNDC